MFRFAKHLFLLIALCGGAFLLKEKTGGAAPSRDLASLKDAFRRPEQIPFPSSNLFSEAKYQLGKQLYFDPRLSGSGTMSCASCHNSEHSWTDGRPRALGHGNKILDRKSPTILNMAWGTSFFWDGRANSIEAQALGPIQSPNEMNMELPKLVSLLGSIDGYRSQFKSVFPGEPLSGSTIAKAIATFERTVVSDVAPFDRWVEGEESAIGDSAKRGFVLFNGQANCVKCHNGWNFTNGSFADIGLRSPDEGRGKIDSNKALAFAFKVPTLRNIVRRAPYMHDGSLTTLDAVLENYSAGGTIARPMTKLFLKPLSLSKGDKDDLISFLETLSSKDEPITAPVLPGEKP